MQSADADAHVEQVFRDNGAKVVPLNRHDPGPSHKLEESLTQRLESAAMPNPLSLKSDSSIYLPPEFSPEPVQEPLLTQREESTVPSHMSLKSDGSIYLPPEFSSEPVQDPLHSPGAASSSFCCVCVRTLCDPVITSRGLYCQLCYSENMDQSSSSLQSGHKRYLMLRYERVHEGTNTESKTFLNKIYTELFITEGHNESVSTQHEEKQLETLSKNIVPSAAIRIHDIFKPLPSDPRPTRVVLTYGVAGVGKTFSVQKFTLDWAQNLENHDVDLVVPLSFRELNLVRQGCYSLLTLIQMSHVSLNEITAETLAQRRVLFIFDGLDESRQTLPFHKCKGITEVTQRAKVGVLLVNLIKGMLLPSALIWITSRPAAANQISVEFVDRFTEVRGFVTGKQKQEYFRKRFMDEELCSRVLTHITKCKSLNIMCQIPVFCWITARVLEYMLRTEDRGALPQTLTDMYAHFLLVQTLRKRKYRQEASVVDLTPLDVDVILKLGKLAFNHLQKGNFMFYQEDLLHVGLDLTEGSLYSGLCTEIFKQESVTFNNPQSIYCFVHLSVQEFLAAVYMHYCFNKKIKRFYKSWKHHSTIDIFLKVALKKAFESPNGHLDLFVRFLHGLVLESNQELLKNLLDPIQTVPEVRQKVINNLKEMNAGDISPDRSINIFHCLTELHERSVHQHIQDLLKTGKRSGKLSEIQCSALAYMMQMSEDVLEELDLKKYNTSPEGRLRLLPAVRNCRKALLSDCKLSKIHIEVVASALKSNPSHLVFLDLSLNPEVNSEMKVLCDGLQSPHCQLQTLRLNTCSLSESSSSSLALSLKSNPSHLRELALGGNVLKDSTVAHLCAFLQSPHCQMETLILYRCAVSESGCLALVSALKSNLLHLKKLDLGFIEMKTSAVEHLCSFLQNPDCRLETLELNNCSLPESSCALFASALKSNPLYLKEFILWGNNLKEADVQDLLELRQSPHCQLDILLWR
ncbi:protein NLRC3-like isoform X2 [Periophthalmus magnuspinnatus]|uniref:protein NLRC3-like isoform X2 n=1 Tax=Periophthalmus magnuspinnatus TaxID=409849 RepID=UPI00145A4137|nr:protein NLRC3-like isoform X2 [Periophthalmus magnuspinnatus]